MKALLSIFDIVSSKIKQWINPATVFLVKRDKERGFYPCVRIKNKWFQLCDNEDSYVGLSTKICFYYETEEEAEQVIVKYKEILKGVDYE